MAVRRWMRAGLVALAIAGAPLVAAAAEAPAQLRCRQMLGRHGLQLTTAAGGATLVCVRDALRGARSHARTDPASIARCLTSALDTRLGVRTRRITRTDAAWCAVRPDFGYADAATIIAAARGGPRAVLTALFGESLAAITPAAAHDPVAARCQWQVARAAVRLYVDWWKAAVDVARQSATDAGDFRDALLAAVDADRQPAPQQLTAFRHAVDGACRAPAPGLFAVVCPADAPDLGSCVARVVAREVYAAVAAVFAVDVPCDLADDGAHDYSCVPPALAEHVLNRLGYGPDPWTLARLRALGVRGYVEEQLHPESIADDAVDAMLAQYPSLTMNFLALRTHYPNRPAPGQAQSGDILKELQDAKVLRAIASRRQLEHVLVDFWFNHFNVAATDRRDYDISPYERIAIRPHVLGRFRDLLLAVTRSPAMGDYLDLRRDRFNAINENFARELMELHTIGVDAGFTEDDVRNVARAFTGWKENQFAPDGFEYVEQFHDPGPKTVLGTTLPVNGGYQEGVAVLDLLAAHPGTAKRIARQLAVRFVSDTPPPALVDAAAATYLATDGDLRAVLETILLSPEFLDDAANRRAKVKRPLDLLASIARATAAHPAELNLDRIRRRIRELGEDLYLFPAPSGYPDVSAYWTSPGTVLQRFNVADLAARGVDGIVPVYPPTDRAATAIVDGLATQYFLAGVSDATRAAAVAFVDAVGEADLAARPAAAASVLLSSPEFQVH